MPEIKVPVAWNLAGGYQTPLSKVLSIHENTMKECASVYIGADRGREGKREGIAVNSPSEVILEVGTAGGGVTLVGTKTTIGWLFSRQTNEWIAESEDEGRTKSERVDSWDAALALLNKYPWHRFYPVTVHPDFKQQIWAVVQKLWADERKDTPLRRKTFEAWRRRCEGEPFI
jgi:hypothetical protein